MTLEEAQDILQLCRPDHPADREDPLIAEALALLDSDPALREWFEAQQAFDRRMAGALQAIEVPAGLRAGILAAARERGSTVPFSRPNPVGEEPPTRDRAWWRQPWFAVAAAAVLALAFILVQLPREPQAGAPQVATAGAPDLILFLAEQIEQLPHQGLDKMDHRYEELDRYLTAQSAPTPQRLPGSLDHLSLIGCTAFDYDGVKVSMICFRNGQVYHLITVQRDSLDEALPETPSDYQMGAQAFRLWQQDGQVFILSTHGRCEQLHPLI